MEAGAVGRIHRARHVDHGVSAFCKPGKGVGPIERALDPFDMGQRLPFAACERPHPKPALAGEAEQVAADEAGAAGDREQRQSITI
jgi:hypothetical protein